MKSDDFEVASSGNSVQNERPERSDADRNDSTNCHASVLAGRSAKASTDRKSTRLNSSHRCISYAVFCLKKKKYNNIKKYILSDKNHISTHSPKRTSHTRSFFYLSSYFVVVFFTEPLIISPHR